MIKDMDGMFAAIIFGFTSGFFFGSILILVLNQEALVSGFKLAKYKLQ